MTKQFSKFPAKRENLNTTRTKEDLKTIKRAAAKDIEQNSLIKRIMTVRGLIIVIFDDSSPDRLIALFEPSIFCSLI